MEWVPDKNNPYVLRLKQNCDRFYPYNPPISYEDVTMFRDVPKGRVIESKGTVIPFSKIQEEYRIDSLEKRITEIEDRVDSKAKITKKFETN